eukprot:TRINITY_DN8476_c0_g1_i3.p1 TRINITY_DN8476_c0_g1~~TRINITY_DN8476_c0_g1_i3.p1  ORF type:complete len:126 (-),score=23.67 TRINITY_DN8476_c0_g1_i3:91-468(-)
MVPSSSSQSGKGRVTIDYGVWLVQLLIWNVIVVSSKLFLYLAQWIGSSLWVSLASWIFQSLHQSPLLKLLVVMVAVPTIMNSIQFWIQDNFLKKHLDEKDDPEIKSLFFEEDQTEIELGQMEVDS